MRRYSIRGRVRKAYTLVRSLLELNSTLRELDLKRFREIETKYREAAPSPGFSKYLDIRHWMRVNLERIYLLGLHHKQPRRILDLGTGTGYFPFLCRRFGHEALGLDIVGNPMYDELIEFLGVSRTLAIIQPRQPVPVDGMRFDWVTAFMIRFQTDWNLDDWGYFLRDVRERLLFSRGGLCLSFNQAVHKYREAHLAVRAYDADICENVAIIRA